MIYVSRVILKLERRLSIEMFSKSGIDEDLYIIIYIPNIARCTMTMIISSHPQSFIYYVHIYLGT